MAQIRDHLGEMLTTAGFGDLWPVVDLNAVADNAERVRKMMADRVPPGCVRAPGVGLRRADA